MKARRLTVLISGTGSNLLALIDAVGQGRITAEIVHVISNNAQAGGLEHARRAGIPCSVLEHDRFANRSDFDCALNLLMAVRQPDLVILAGFMRILGAAVLQEFAGRIVNLHPSLLPRHPGRNTYQRAIEAGDTRHGASMHFVTAELDAGPVVSQVRILIRAGDSPETLASRLAPREHALIVATIELFTTHSVQCVDDSVWVDGRRLEQPLLLQDEKLLAP